MNAIKKSLAVVEIFKPGEVPEVIETLGEQWFNEIDVFLKKQSRAPEIDERVVAKLLDLSSKRRWLLCGCRGAHDGLAPVLYPVKTPKSERAVTLVPLYERNDHLDCALHRDQPINLKGIAEAPRSSKSDGLGMFFEMSGSGLPKDLTARPVTRMSTRKRMPTLARVLFTVLEGAGLNTVRLNGPALTVQMEALQAFLKTQFLDQAKTVSAAPWFALSVKQVDDLSKRLLAGRTAFGKLQPHAFVVDVVEKHESPNGQHRLVNNRGEISFDGRLYIPGEKTPGPWLMIALLVLLPHEKKPSFRQAYIHPLAKPKCYVLADSNLERETLKILEVSLYPMSAIGRPYSICKPLTDIEVDGQGVRPDFIVTQGSRSLIVETMGYSDEDYRLQKARTHQLMVKIEGGSELIEHNPGQEVQFKKEFTDWLTDVLPASNLEPNSSDD